jgi:uncharacterized protein YecT (DUF1311 family)
MAMVRYASYRRHMPIPAMIAAAAAVLTPNATTARAETASTGADAPCWRDGTTVAIVNCFAASRKQSDAELNRTYARIMSVLDTADQQRLRKAERAWVAYRDASCDAEYRLWDGGTGGPPALLACLDGETRRRLEHLQTTYRLRLQRLGS